MNWYSIFYWLTVANNFKDFFEVMIILSMIGLFLSLIFWISGRENGNWDKVTIRGKYGRKFFFYTVPFVMLFWFLYLFTPTKTETLFIIAGGAVGEFITSDTNARQIPPDLMLYLRTKLKEETMDVNSAVREELGLSTPKEKYIDDLKDLTKEAIIERLKSDTTLIR